MLQWIKHNNQKILRTTVILQIAVVIFVLLFYFTPAQAAEVTPGPQQGAALDTAATGIQYAGQIGLGGDDIRTIVASIIRIALGLIGIILVVLMMYAGFLWMTAGGNDEQIVRAKSILRNAVIGLAIVLSAYSIVLFVMKMLGIGEGGGETPVEISGPNTQNFQGSGALGAVIKDHYPGRNQEEVPRNVKIVVTFRRPVLLSSFVEEHSGNNVLGDCRDKGAEAIVWKDDCDQLIMNNNLINISRVVQNGNQFVLQPLENGAVVLAASTEIGGIKGVYTIVIRPNDLLGSSAEKFTYLVHLGRGLLLDDPANPNLSVFSVKVMGNDYYEWQFSCSTELDISPPHVVSVSPPPGRLDYMNTAIQINFSEPMDPTGLQGVFQDNGDGYYTLQGNNIFLKSNNSTLPAGNFNIVNNYQTLEFIPSRVCGQNTCGGKIFCMNVCDKVGAACRNEQVDGESVKADDFEMVVKAGLTNAPHTTFEAMAFSGAMDLSGNALDSAPLGQIDQAVNDPVTFANNPDNYYWKFSLVDKKYDQEPYLQKIVPGLNAENITANQEWKMDFSATMLFEPLYDIAIEELPIQAPPICKVPRAFYNQETGTTTVSMFHCPFLSGRPIYYMPILTEALQEIHFNCFNPGKGPGGDDEVRRGALESSICDADHPANCCPTVKGSPDQIFCCNGLVNTNRKDSGSCLEFIKNPPPS